MPLDPYQVFQADHAHGLSADLQDLRAGQQILVGADGLQVGQKVKRILGVDLEGEVGPIRNERPIQRRTDPRRPRLLPPGDSDQHLGDCAVLS